MSQLNIESINHNLPSILLQDNPEHYRINSMEPTIVQIWSWNQYRKCYIWHNWLHANNMHEAVGELMILKAQGKNVIGLAFETIEVTRNHLKKEHIKIGIHLDVLT